jgi:hypothetical protein
MNLCKQITEKDPMNYIYVERYATALAQQNPSKLEAALEQ